MYTHVTMNIHIYIERERDASDIASKDLIKINMRPKLCRLPYAAQQTNTVV